MSKKAEYVHIVKYTKNRMLYNLSDRERTNLVKMADLVKDGYDLKITLDSEDGMDITTEMLLSIMINTGLEFKKEGEVQETLYYLIENHLKIPKDRRPKN